MTPASHFLAILALSLFPPAAPAGSACCDESSAGVEHAGHVQEAPPAQAQPEQGGNKFSVAPLRQPQPRALPRTGQLAIQAVQGTPGGPAIGDVPVEVHLYHRGDHIDTIEAALDKHGVLVIEDLPIAMGIQPLVQIKYSGMTYQRVGEVMDPSRPDQSLRISCYEPTEEPPAWTVAMRHVVLTPAPEGINVTEVIVVNNPGDHTWIGSPAYAGFARSDGEEKAITTVFPLPANAKGVELGRGFHDWCCTTLDGIKLANHLPVTPGNTEMVFGYTLPARKGAVTLELPAPAATAHLLILVPESTTVTRFTGLTPGGSETLGESKMQMYSANSLGAGELVALTVTGFGEGGAQASASFARTAAAIGGGVILLIAIVVVFVRPRSTTPRAAVQAPPAQVQ